MRVATLEATPVSFPYVHREVSSQVARDGVTDIIVRIETDDGCVGWGEACSGADVVSIEAAIHAMAPFVIGGDPWHREAIQTSCTSTGSGSSAPEPRTSPGRDRHGARGRCGARRRAAAVQPVRRSAAARGELLLLPRARHAPRISGSSAVPGSRAGYDTFYLKVGVDPAADLAMVEAVRGRARPGPSAPARRERRVVRPEARGCSARWPSTTSTSSSSPSDTTPWAIWPSCAGACRWPCARTRACGARQTPMRASSRGRPTCTASARTGSARSRVPASGARRAPGGPAGLQAHPRRARDRGGRLPPPAAHAAERRRGASADRAPDGGRRAARAASDRDGTSLGRAGRHRARSRAGAEAIADGHRRYELEGQFLPYQAEHLRRWGGP